MAQIYAEFDDKEVRSFLKDIDKNVDRVKSVKNEYIGLLSAIVYKDVIKHFESEEGSSGPWAKWSSSYKDKMKEEGKDGNKILQDSGRLRNTFSPKKYRKVSGGILWFNNAEVKGFPYAFAHDEGGKKLPKRDCMWLS